MVDILILSHRYDRPMGDLGYSINILVDHWRRMGLNVANTLGPSRLRDGGSAAVVVNHVGLTVTPAAYIKFLRRFSRAVNGELTNTSKSAFCQNLVSQPDDYDGSVIVKTELDSGSAGEHAFRPRSGPAAWLRYLRGADAGLSKTKKFTRSRYLIYDHPDLVPAKFWGNPHFVIQKFQAEMESEDLFRLRSWYVLGDRDFHVLTVSKKPIVKGHNIIDRWVVDLATPPEMTAMRKAMRVDYGRFDYVIVEGKPVVFDINRTPISTAGAVAKYAPQWEQLAEGIKSFLS